MSELKKLRCVGGPLDGQFVASANNYLVDFYTFEAYSLDELIESRVRYILDEKAGELIWLLVE